MAPRPTPPNGYVHLILYAKDKQDPFYLEIPVQITLTLCKYPGKYLQYLGWAILGIEGVIKDEQSNGIDMNNALVDRGTYYYILPQDTQDPLSYAIDLEVIKAHSDMNTQTSTQVNFRDSLKPRDGMRCVWESFPDPIAMHIVPWAKGDEWLQVIIKNRPWGDEEQLDTLVDINDIRNGLLGDLNVHFYFDHRRAVVLKTPNPILGCQDIPERCNDHIILDNAVRFPPSSRYTLQHLTSLHRSVDPNNSDAAFVDPDMPLPSGLLLHYHYAAAAVDRWGKNLGILATRPNLPRPTGMKPVGPKQTIGDRELTRETTQQQTSNSGGSTTPALDADDLVLFLWANTPSARERLAQEEREQKDVINSWRDGVSP